MRVPPGPCSLACVAVLLACAACSPAKQPAETADTDISRPLPSPVPDVVARVNGQAIHLAQLVPMAKAELARLPHAEPERRKAEAVRRALQKYVERELLVQEALARGVTADTQKVDWSYDQMRREHTDDAGWALFLAGQGMDPQSFRAELRLQQTVTALLERDSQARGVSPDEARAALLETLRAKARIELFL
jgi:LPS sulfotransferase NodH